jgi:SAM-dependent methyltransferase
MNVKERRLDTVEHPAAVDADAQGPRLRTDGRGGGAAGREQAAEAAQPWPGQLRLRRIELGLLQAQVRIPRVGRILELGCGNAAGIALLRDRARLLVASDLPKVDAATHSIGMTAPRQLLAALDVDNARLVGCPAEVLPFRDAAFDLVFSFFVLEHVPDRDAALAEMYRVLRRGGRAIAFVPNYVERTWAPLAFYLYLLGRPRDRLGDGGTVASLDPTAMSEPVAESDAAGTGRAPAPRRPFREAYPHFPLPSPHGEYRHSLAELLAHRPSRWRALFERHGFVVERQRFTMTLPLNLLGLVVGERYLDAYERLANLDRRLGGSAAGLLLGQYGFLVARRPA